MPSLRTCMTFSINLSFLLGLFYLAVGLKSAANEPKKWRRQTPKIITGIFIMLCIVAINGLGGRRLEIIASVIYALWNFWTAFRILWKGLLLAFAMKIHSINITIVKQYHKFENVLCAIYFVYVSIYGGKTLIVKPTWRNTQLI